MDRCFRLALKGTGNVSPNPLVGAVLVKDGVKIGEGFHERFGGHHAEINAIQNALAKKKEIHGSTLYVNLEPCSHHGKTPPCVDAVIRHGIARVVIGCMDPNPVVAGRGIARLREKNIKVRCGIRVKEAERLNQAFFKYILTGRPFITMKAAQTADGYIARTDGSSQWITNQWSRRFVHHLRNENDAVLVGSGTVLQDDPELTVRSVPGRNPYRVILDGRFRVPLDRKIFNEQAKTILYISDQAAAREKTKVRSLERKGVTVVPMRKTGAYLDLHSVLIDLGNRGIASVMIEGGSGIYTSFLNAALIDSMLLFTAQKKFRNGITTFGKLSVSFKKKLVSERTFRTDRLQEFRITFP